MLITSFLSWLIFFSYYTLKNPFIRFLLAIVILEKSFQVFSYFFNRSVSLHDFRYFRTVSHSFTSSEQSVRGKGNVLKTVKFGQTVNKQ